MWCREHRLHAHVYFSFCLWPQIIARRPTAWPGCVFRQYICCTKFHVDVSENFYASVNKCECILLLFGVSFYQMYFWPRVFPLFPPRLVSFLRSRTSTNLSFLFLSALLGSFLSLYVSIIFLSVCACGSSDCCVLTAPLFSHSRTLHWISTSGNFGRIQDCPSGRDQG
jgi:hypothetical protein